MGGIVVYDHMDDQVLVSWMVEYFQTTQKLIVAVLGQTLADHPTVMDIEGDEQGCGSMTFLVIRHRSVLTGFHR